LNLRWFCEAERVPSARFFTVTVEHQALCNGGESRADAALEARFRGL
jgi:hypothetical protein